MPGPNVAVEDMVVVVVVAEAEGVADSMAGAGSTVAAVVSGVAMVEEASAGAMGAVSEAAMGVAAAVVMVRVTDEAAGDVDGDGEAAGDMDSV
jgi:hypothetical protein